MKLFSLMRILILGLFVSLILPINNAISLVMVSPPFETFLDSATKIVRGKILNVIPIIGIKDNQKYTCGWNMDIEVITNFKGGNKSFTLFTNHLDSFLGEQFEYFIVTNQQYRTRIRPECVENPDVPFDWNSAKFNSYGNAQLIFPIDPDTKEKFGEDWMMVYSMKHKPYPWPESFSLMGKHHEPKRAWNGYGPRPYHLYRLQDIIDLITR